MPSYLVAGMALRAAFAIPELPEAGDDDRAADWSVEASAPDARVPDVTPVYEIRTPDDAQPWAVLAAGDGVFRLTYAGKADFVVDSRARTVSYRAEPGLADSTFRHLLIDQVVPHLAAIGGELVLHASAVVPEDGHGAVLFIGVSGTGKSSLAGAHVAAGARLIADDYVVVRERADGGYVAVPAYPALRLWRDAVEHLGARAADLPAVADYTDKRRWPAPGEARRDSVPIRAIVALGDDPGAAGPVFAHERLWGTDAFALLAAQAFRVERSDPAFQRADLARFVALAQRVPVVLVEYRRDYAVIGEVLAGLRAALEDVSSE